MPLGVLKDTDSMINYSDRSVAETNSEFKPFILYVMVADENNTSVHSWIKYLTRPVAADSEVTVCLFTIFNAGLKIYCSNTTVCHMFPLSQPLWFTPSSTVVLSLKLESRIMGSSPYQLLQVLSSPNSRLRFNYRKCQDGNEFMINERHLRLLKYTADMTFAGLLGKTIPL